MADRDDELGITDTPGLPDADWTEISKLRTAYDSGGDKASVREVALHPRGLFCGPERGNWRRGISLRP
jgi:hypothetical protein